MERSHQYENVQSIKSKLQDAIKLHHTQQTINKITNPNQQPSIDVFRMNKMKYCMNWVELFHQSYTFDFVVVHVCIVDVLYYC